MPRRLAIARASYGPTHSQLLVGSSLGQGGDGARGMVVGSHLKSRQAHEGAGLTAALGLVRLLLRLGGAAKRPKGKRHLFWQD